MFILCGALFAVSAEHSGGTDLRGGRYTDLASVVQAERNDTNELTDEVADLTAEIETLTAGLGDRRSTATRTRSTPWSTRPASPRAPVPAVKVTLDDAPQDLIETTTATRSTSSSTSRTSRPSSTPCGEPAPGGHPPGPARHLDHRHQVRRQPVTLHGVPYSPPYEIVGIGVPDADPRLARRTTATSTSTASPPPTRRAAWATTWRCCRRRPRRRYEGLLDLTWATPMADRRARTTADPSGRTPPGRRWSAAVVGGRLRRRLRGDAASPSASRWGSRWASRSGGCGSSKVDTKMITVSPWSAVAAGLGSGRRPRPWARWRSASCTTSTSKPACRRVRVGLALTEPDHVGHRLGPVGDEQGDGRALGDRLAAGRVGAR